jgi:hypothetical protein
MIPEAGWAFIGLRPGSQGSCRRNLPLPWSRYPWARRRRVRLLLGSADLIVKRAKPSRAALSATVATAEPVVRRRYHDPVRTAPAVGHPRAVIVTCRTRIEAQRFRCFDDRGLVKSGKVQTEQLARICALRASWRSAVQKRDGRGACASGCFDLTRRIRRRHTNPRDASSRALGREARECHVRLTSAPEQ